MFNQKLVGFVAYVALILSIAGLVGGNHSVPEQKKLGGVTNYDAVTLDNGDLTLSRGNISVSNTSTSTLQIGNITTYATSTATRICLKPSILGATSTFTGTVYFVYGACPF